MWFKFFFIIIIIVFLPIYTFSQSSYLEEGVSASGFFVNAVVDDSGLKTIGFSTAYSIGGVMDFGLSLNTQQDTIDNNESTDLNFSLLYNMIIIKQNTLQPINIQLQGKYGYINTSSDYLEYYDLRRTGQGFDIGVAVFRKFFSDSILSLNVGVDLNYRNYLIMTFDYSDPFNPEIVANSRLETIKYGGTVALIIQPELLPFLSIELNVMYEPIADLIEYSPSISLVNPQF